MYRVVFKHDAVTGSTEMYIVEKANGGLANCKIASPTGTVVSTSPIGEGELAERTALFHCGPVEVIEVDV